MSGVKALNALAAVIHRAMQSGRQTPMGLAVAVDSAQMLMCPETAEDLVRLRKRVAELEAELRIGSPWTCSACGKENNRDVCVVCETERPEPVRDVSPQVRKLRAILARQAGERR